MFNPNDKKHISRLVEARRESYRRFECFRGVRSETIRQYVGRHYGENAAYDKVPLNLIELATSVYIMQLAANAPAALITTRRNEFKGTAVKLQEGVRRDIHETNLEDTLERWVRDALFLFGVVKCGVEDVGTEDYGGVFITPVDFDDWVHDWTARSFGAASFMGDRYRVELEWAKDNPSFNKDEREKLSRIEDYGYNEDGSERVENLGTGQDYEEKTFQDETELWDLWIPETKQVVVIPAEGAPEKALRVIDWEGEENGPYHELCFSTVPNRAMPSPPAHHWYDLHDLANRIFNKTARQAEAQKTVTAVRAGADADAKRIVEANDLDTISVQDPQNINALAYGGVNPGSLAFVLQCRDLQSHLAGNLDLLGGLGAQSETLGQDRILSASASKRMAQYQKKVERALEKLIRALAWYRMADPLTEQDLPYRIPGTERDVMLRWTPDDRADSLQFDYKITPYSTQYRSPGERLAQLTQIMTQLVFPMLPMLQQMGIGVDMKRFFKIAGQYMDMEELEEVLVFMGTDAAGAGGSTERPLQSPTTTRENVRINRPGATAGGKADIATRLLNQLGTQDSETQALMRPTG